MVKNLIFLLFAVLAGLTLITLISEGVEILVVTTMSGKSLSELAQDQTGYFAIRNAPSIVALKLVYNTFAAFIGGYVCAVIARSRILLSVYILAGIQTLGFVYGMTLSEYADTTALWLWLSLMILSVGSIIGSGYFRTMRADSRMC